MGADSKTGLVHSAVVTSANVHDKHPLPDLLRGDEKRVYGDRDYQGCRDIIKAKAPQARDFTNLRVRKPDGEDDVERSRNRTESKTPFAFSGAMRCPLAAPLGGGCATRLMRIPYRRGRVTEQLGLDSIDITRSPGVSEGTALGNALGQVVGQIALRFRQQGLEGVDIGLARSAKCRHGFPGLFGVD